MTHVLPPLASAFLGQLTGKRASTVKTYEGGLRIFSRWCDAEGLDLLQCTSNDVSRYLHTLASEGRSASTVAGYGTTLRVFYGWLLKTGQVSVNPALHVWSGHPKKPNTEVLSLDELRRLFWATNEGEAARAVIGLLGVVGLQSQDVASASVKDLVRADGQPLRLRLADGHLAALPPLVERAVLAASDRRSGPLLLNMRGHGVDRAAQNRMIAAAGRLVGLEAPVSAQVLTQTMGALVITAGASFASVVQSFEAKAGLRFLVQRSRVADVPELASFRLAALLSHESESTEARLDEAAALPALRGVRPIAVVALAGAALEAHLRDLSVAHGGRQPRTGLGDLTYFAQQLRSQGVFTDREVREVGLLSPVRNLAAHGCFDQLDDDTAARFLLDVRRFVAKHPARESSPE